MTYQIYQSLHELESKTEVLPEHGLDQYKVNGLVPWWLWYVRWSSLYEEDLPDSHWRRHIEILLESPSERNALFTLLRTVPMATYQDLKDLLRRHRQELLERCGKTSTVKFSTSTPFETT